MIFRTASGTLGQWSFPLPSAGPSLSWKDFPGSQLEGLQTVTLQETRDPIKGHPAVTDRENERGQVTPRMEGRMLVSAHPVPSAL